MEVSTANQNIAHFYQSHLKGEQSFTRLKDKDSEISIDVMSVSSQLDKDISTCVTIGLSSQGVPAELIAIAKSRFTDIDQLLSTTAFSILQEKWPLSVGSIIPEIVSLYTEGEMNHLLLMPPFLWDSSLEELAINEKKIFTYLIVPISDSEREFGQEYGIEKLIELLNIYDIDISDLERSSVEIPALF